MNIIDARKMVEELSWLSAKGWTSGKYVTNKQRIMTLHVYSSDNSVFSMKADFPNSTRFNVNSLGYIRSYTMDRYSSPCREEDERIVGYAPEWMTEYPKVGDKFMLHCGTIITVESFETPVLLNTTTKTGTLKVLISEIYTNQIIQKYDWVKNHTGRYGQVLGIEDKYARVGLDCGETAKWYLQHVELVSVLDVPTFKPEKTGFYVYNKDTYLWNKNGNHKDATNMKNNFSTYIGNGFHRKLSQQEIKELLCL